METKTLKMLKFSTKRFRVFLKPFWNGKHLTLQLSRVLYTQLKSVTVYTTFPAFQGLIKEKKKLQSRTHINQTNISEKVCEEIDLISNTLIC